MKGAHRHADEPEQQQGRVPAAGRVRAVAHDLRTGHPRDQRHRVALAAAAAAHVAGRGAFHAADVDQRRAVGQAGDAAGARFPARPVHLEVQRREPRQQTEHAAHGAQVAAPHPLATPVQQTHQHGRHGGAAQHQQGGLGVLVHAHELAVDGGDDKGHGGPAAPAHPARDAAPASVAAHRFAQRTLGAEHPAPDAAQQDHAQQHEGPPDAPEQELREQAQVVQDACGVVGQRQKRRQHHQHRVGQHDGPLHAADQAAMAAHGVAQGRQRTRRAARHEVQGHGGCERRGRGGANHTIRCARVWHGLPYRPTGTGTGRAGWPARNRPATPIQNPA